MNRPRSTDAQQIAEATTQTLLQEVEELMARDQRRKALLVIPLAIGVGAAIATQATWLLAVAGTGLLLAQLPHRRA
jgi:hypothetical protein